MSKLLVVFSSVTTTARLKRLLEGECKKAEIVQVPKNLSKHGCNFGIKVDETHLKRVIELIKDIDVKHRGIFIEKITPDGKKYIPY